MACAYSFGKSLRLPQCNILLLTFSTLSSTVKTSQKCGLNPEASTHNCCILHDISCGNFYPNWTMESLVLHMTKISAKEAKGIINDSFSRNHNEPRDRAVLLVE